jgi:hypothetical protein
VTEALDCLEEVDVAVLSHGAFSPKSVEQADKEDWATRTGLGRAGEHWTSRVGYVSPQNPCICLWSQTVITPKSLVLTLKCAPSLGRDETHIGRGQGAQPDFFVNGKAGKSEGVWAARKDVALPTPDLGISAGPVGPTFEDKCLVV